MKIFYVWYITDLLLKNIASLPALSPLKHSHDNSKLIWLRTTQTSQDSRYYTLRTRLEILCITSIIFIIRLISWVLRFVVGYLPTLHMPFYWLVFVPSYFQKAVLGVSIKKEVLSHLLTRLCREMKHQGCSEDPVARPLDLQSAITSPLLIRVPSCRCIGRGPSLHPLSIDSPHIASMPMCTRNA